MIAVHVLPDPDELHRRVARVEIAVMALLEHHGLPQPTEEQVDEVLEEEW